MKISKIILYAMFLIGIISCGKKTETSTPTASASTDVNAKIVFVNIDSLLQGYDLYKEQKKALENESSATEKTLSAKIEAFQKRSMKFQREVYETQQKAANIAPVELKALEEKYNAQGESLAKEEQALMKQRDDAALGLDKKLTDLQLKLINNIDAYLEKMATEKGYDYILRKGDIGGVMFGKKEYDVTADAIKGLNEEHNKTK
jgi:outer membrane protein